MLYSIYTHSLNPYKDLNSLIFSFSSGDLPAHNAGRRVLSLRIIQSWKIFLTKELDKHNTVRISACYTLL